MSALPFGAPDKYALESRIGMIQRYLRSAGFDVVIAAPDTIWTLERPWGPRRKQKQRIPRPGHPTGARSIVLLNSTLSFLRTLRYLKHSPQNKPFVILAQGVWTAMLARILTGLHPLAKFHLDVPGIPDREVQLAKPRMWRPKTTVYRALFAAEVEWSQLITTINLAHADYILQRFGQRAVILPDCLDPTWLHELLAIPEKSPGEGTEVLYVGAISRSRLDLFFESLEPLLRDGRVTVHIIGAGADLPRYRHEYARLGVLFDGYVPKDQVVASLASADICYSDVWHEIGTPYKVIEYMAAGKAVISHDTTSMRELITNDVDGVLCSADRSSLADGIAKLAASPAKRAELGRRARDRIVQLHSTDFAEELSLRYKNLLRPASLRG